MSDYKKITTEDLSLNPFKRIAKDWMLKIGRAHV